MSEDECKCSFWFLCCGTWPPWLTVTVVLLGGELVEGLRNVMFTVPASLPVEKTSRHLLYTQQNILFLIGRWRMHK